MEFRVILSDEAELDFHNIPDFYNQFREGLGEEAQDEVLFYLEKLKVNAYLYQKRVKEIRVSVTKRFHFGIFYFIDEQEKAVRVIGIINTKENSLKITSRII